MDGHVGRRQMLRRFRGHVHSAPRKPLSRPLRGHVALTHPLAGRDWMSSLSRSAAEQRHDLAAGDDCAETASVDLEVRAGVSEVRCHRLHGPLRVALSDALEDLLMPGDHVLQ